MAPDPSLSSLSLLQSIVDVVPDAILVVDSSGRIVLTNPASASLFGYEQNELRGTAVDSLVPIGARRRHAEHRGAFGRAPGNRTMGAGRQLRARRKDGRLVPVDISLSAVTLAEGTFVIAIARDVAVYQHFLEVCPIAIFVAENAHVTYANQAALRLVGVTEPERSAPARLVDFFHPDDRASMRKWLAAAETPGEILRSRIEERIVRADGGVRHVESTSVLVPNTPEPTVLVAMQDVTERRQAVDRARTQEGALQQQQRLADIGAVTTRIVHDIANPVAGLIMGTQRALQMLDRLPSEMAGPVRPSVDRVLATSRHLETLLQEFKDFARQQRLDLQYLALAPFLTEVREAWAAEAVARDVDLHMDCAPDLGVRGDQLKLRRVLDNLLKNALEAIDRGPGDVRVTAVCGDPGKLLIAVSDSGPGVPVGMDPFALFETTKPTGTGLGLPSVRQIVEAHGGTVTLMPGKGPGAAFHIELPLAPRPA